MKHGIQASAILGTIPFATSTSTAVVCKPGSAATAIAVGIRTCKVFQDATELLEHLAKHGRFRGQL
eukprot:CAMPEP_0198111524 /NCGR_PEP_ID=MMETSP1442-20131203/3501_1 /TAXON_ID= /ORGANISM="Craspedostauros australis, Strain CCMP3328" /LENGTH=65 /DNA_ID=CAMNT_0043768001 /DNA_START=512 /DNA_END=706 /DNA_ORIENTATION=-